MTVSQIHGSIPYTREEYQRHELASKATLELLYLRAGMEVEFEWLPRLIDWLESEFSPEKFSSSHFYHIRGSPLQAGLVRPQSGSSTRYG